MLYLFLLCLLSRCRVHSEMTSIGVWISSLRHKEALFSLFTCYVTWPCMQPYTKEGSLKNGGLVASLRSALTVTVLFELDDYVI